MNTVMKVEAPASDRNKILAFAGDSSWKSLYRVGGIAALIAVLAGLVDIFIMFLPGTGATPGTRSVADWFYLFQNQWFLAFRDLGLLNMVTTLCSVLIFFALVGIHRRTDLPYAALALILVCMGATIYIANNISLPMLTLSSQYAAVSSETQKSMLLAAGQVLLAREDVGAGTFMGFFIPEVAGILMSVVMLRGKVFSIWTAWIGILGEGFLAIFNICAAFIPGLFDIVMNFAKIGGPLSLLWFILIAYKLFRLSGSLAPEPTV
jgi:predicted neutral ceramidase superfamily lipid hydrolase